jgi:hypothetical protein
VSSSRRRAIAAHHGVAVAGPARVADGCRGRTIPTIFGCYVTAHDVNGCPAYAAAVVIASSFIIGHGRVLLLDAAQRARKEETHPLRRKPLRASRCAHDFHDGSRMRESVCEAHDSADSG